MRAIPVAVYRVEHPALRDATLLLLPEVGTDPVVNRAYTALVIMARVLEHGEGAAVVGVELTPEGAADLVECLTRLGTKHDLEDLRCRLAVAVADHQQREDDEAARAERRDRESVRQSRRFLFPR